MKFGAVGPATGTRAYAELVKVGMVEHRYDVGHFLLSTTPLETELERHRIPALVHLDSIEAALRSAFAETQRLREDTRTVMHAVEFQDKRTGERFGESLHPSRPARVGEDPATAVNLASHARETIRDGSMYGVQICSRTVNGTATDTRGDGNDDHSNE